MIGDDLVDQDVATSAHMKTERSLAGETRAFS
jgi:hypothetical protein